MSVWPQVENEAGVAAPTRTSLLGVIPRIWATYSTIGNSALVTNAINFAPAPAASTYRVSVAVNVRTAAAVNMFVVLAYKDGAGVTRSENMILNLNGTSQTPVVNINNVTGRYNSSCLFQIDNSATAITVSTGGTTMTLYDFAVILEELT